MKKEALTGFAGAAGGLMGAGIGAATAGEGNRLKGALVGGSLGATGGAIAGRAQGKALAQQIGAKSHSFKDISSRLNAMSPEAIETASNAAKANAGVGGYAGLAGLGAAGGVGYSMRNKQASLCSSIAGTINKTDFDRFNESFANTSVSRMVEKSASVQHVLHSLTAAPIVDTRELAMSASMATKTAGFDVIQIRPNGYGYLVKTSAAPEGMEPQEQQMSAQEAESAGVPQEAMQAADQQGAATMTQVQAQPDPMVEQPVPAQSFGMYKVTNAQNGRQLVGFVIPGLFDPMQGMPTQQSLFTTGNSYSLQPQIMGVLTGISFNLPEANPPRGLGIFYKTDGKSLMATVPYNIVSEVTVEGRTYYSVQTEQGQQLQIVMSEGLQRPVASSQTEIAMPADFKFLPLDNPIQLAGGENMQKQAQAEAWHTMAEIRAWEGGMRLGGPVFEKLGSGEHEWADGLFWLAASGLQQNIAVPVLEKAAHTGEVIRLFGLRPLSGRDEWYDEAIKEAAVDMEIMSRILPPKVNLLKEAAAISMDKEASAMIGVATVDSVLALNFLNPENVAMYAEHVPQLKESAEKLAELVLACQLGLQTVPKTAAVRAMFAIESVIEGLMALREYRL